MPSSATFQHLPAVGKVEQDYLRRTLLREHDGARIDPVAPAFIAATARTALDLGYHVILEGILHAERYATVLHQLINNHPGPAAAFYLDVSFDETVRRHLNRDEPIPVTPDEMRHWYLLTGRAAGVTSQFVIDGVPGRLVIAAAPGGELSHVDLRTGKHGCTLAGLTDALSTAITTGLRAGAPADVFADGLRHTRYDPAGATGDPDAPYATSLGDYLAQRLHHDHPDMAERS